MALYDDRVIHYYVSIDDVPFKLSDTDINLIIEGLEIIASYGVSKERMEDINALIHIFAGG